MRRFKYQKRLNHQSIEGKPITALGIRFGYWPCVKAPFVQVGLFKNTHEVWIA
jgi:hypothetical protein